MLRILTSSLEKHLKPVNDVPLEVKIRHRACPLIHVNPLYKNNLHRISPDISSYTIVALYFYCKY